MKQILHRMIFITWCYIKIWSWGLNIAYTWYPMFGKLSIIWFPYTAGTFVLFKIPYTSHHLDQLNLTTNECCVTSLVKIGPVLLDMKMFFQSIFLGRWVCSQDRFTKMILWFWIKWESRIFTFLLLSSLANGSIYPSLLSLFKNALHQVWLKVAKWFWRWSQSRGKKPTWQTDEQRRHQQLVRKSHLSL